MKGQQEGPGHWNPREEICPKEDENGLRHVFSLSLPAALNGEMLFPGKINTIAFLKGPQANCFLMPVPVVNEARAIKPGAPRNCPKR